MYALLAIFLPIVGLLSRRVTRLTDKNLFLVLAATFVILNLINHFNEFMSSSSSHLGSMFFVGSAFYLWRDNVRLSTSAGLVGLALILLAASVSQAVFYVVYCLALPYVLLVAAYLPKGKIRGFNQLADYSYGIYIYAWPVQQTVVYFMPDVLPLQLALYAFLITLSLAVMSWHLLEKQCLKFKVRH